MRSLRASIAVSVFLALFAGLALAGEAATEKSSVVGPQEVAVFSVPKLAKGSVLKDLAKVLADQPGIVLAQMDPAKKTFNVTFDKQQTNPEEILKSINSVSKNAKLVGVGAADGKSGPGCGGCPSAKKCAGAKKK
jgi:copper chaperone CopZ